MFDERNMPTCHCPDPSLLQNIPLLHSMMERMLVIRRFEQQIQQLFDQGVAYGTTHLSIGEEAAAVGTAFAMAQEDYVLLPHRSHGPAIAKGASISAIMAEMLGKATGCCKGKGGSMHIADVDCGILASNGIVGANAPIACGVAMTSKRKGLGRVCTVFMGDGSSNEGAIHEAMNLAAVWQLPVVFCVIHNQYGMSTKLSDAVVELDLSVRAAGYGMASMECDGNDVLAVYDTATKALRHARTTGPVLLIEHSYRTCGHSKSDKNLYRSQEEIASWEARNPIIRFENFLLQQQLITEVQLQEIKLQAQQAVQDALEYAQSSPISDVAEVLGDIYA